ncbi:phosphodiester glycosidase family protein [Streptomyces sp. NPDC056470]|uniref:phosphodiester glycosidase family protein n=1 Tax=Streptomyces sp. NPDC056470 TaxID=3345831 RepID=UPI003695C599
MRSPGTRTRAAAALLLACCALLGRATPGTADATWTTVAPGVTYRAFDVPGLKGPARVHLVSVDLRDPRVAVDLLTPGAVAARAPLSALADARGAVAGVNGDFFHLTETQHPGVEATGAPVGPAIATGHALKAAVPTGQRFGPALPPGTDTREVLGVGVDRRARLGRLTLDGAVSTPDGRLPLGGLDQYALPVGSVGAFTAGWGEASRVRATCGTDTDRAAPCSSETYEVTVRDGRVVATADTPGRGPIAEGSEVLVGREAGARALRGLALGDRVRLRHRMVAEGSRVPYVFAVGGHPVLRAGAPLPGLDPRTAAVRSAAGVADGGRRLLLLALDGAPAFRTGRTVAEVAALLDQVGAEDGFSLDGGGSSTLVTRDPGAASVTVRNHPSGGVERPVPNAVGIFSRR